MRRWLGIGITAVLLIALVGLAACTRSLSGPAPTVAPYGSATPVVALATQTPTAGQTVVSVETTTPIPTMTPTTEAEATATSTPEPTATAPSATTTPSSTEFTYVVQTGDTLWGLAIRFGTTVEAIKTRNGLTADVIYKDQELIIPGTDPGRGTAVTHVVQPGENLFRIALKYGTTVEAIAAANSIVNPALIFAGQELRIPSGGSPPDGTARYHVVQPGETLWSIALRYDTTPWTIAAANGISNIHYIYAGQTLRIP